MSYSLKPGIVTGDDYKLLLQTAKEGGTPYKKQYDSRKILRAAEVSRVERLDEAFTDLGSVGKSLAQ